MPIKTENVQMWYCRKGNVLLQEVQILGLRGNRKKNKGIQWLDSRTVGQAGADQSGKLVSLNNSALN